MTHYFLVELTGKINFVLLSFVIGLFVMRRLQRNLKLKNKALNDLMKKIVKILSRYHKAAAICLIILGLFHGWIALGGQFRLHTGVLLWFSIITNLLIFMVGRYYKKPKWLKVHRIMALFVMLLLVLHLTIPYLI